MQLVLLYNLYHRHIFALLGVAIAVGVFAYGAFLLGAVAHAAHRSDAQKEINHINGQLSGLENRYLEQMRSLTPERAHEMGFVAPAMVASVVAPVQTLTLRQ